MNKDDLAVLDNILQPCNDPELSPEERRAFSDMRFALRSGDADYLSAKQRAWADTVWERLKPIDLSKVPGKRPITDWTVSVLAAPLPKRPPGRA
jgi:hypothetical protein